MKKDVSLLSADVTNLTSLTEEIRNDEKQVYRLTDDLTEMVKDVKIQIRDMKTNERIFQKRVLNEIGKIFY